MIKFNCKFCNKEFYIYPCRIKQGVKFCSKKCKSDSTIGKIAYNKGISMSEDQKKKISKTRIERGVAKGKNNPRWGKSKYKTSEEKRIANLESGRKSYKKHKKTRRFYYRQLNYKRRNMSGYHTLEQWEKLKKDNNYCCLDCGMQEPFIGQRIEHLTEDHIIPISKWFKFKNNLNYECNDIENIQPLCLKCNVKKYNKTSVRNDVINY